MTPFALAIQNARRRVAACLALGERVPSPHTIQRIAIESGAPPGHVHHLFLELTRKGQKG